MRLMLRISPIQLYRVPRTRFGSIPWESCSPAEVRGPCLGLENAPPTHVDGAITTLPAHPTPSLISAAPHCLAASAGQFSR